MLAQFDDRMLSDIGLTRSDLRDAYSEPLWRDPTHILASRAHERRISRPGDHACRAVAGAGAARPNSACRRPTGASVTRFKFESLPGRSLPIGHDPKPASPRLVRIRSARRPWRALSFCGGAASRSRGPPPRPSRFHTSNSASLHPLLAAGISARVSDFIFDSAPGSSLAPRGSRAPSGAPECLPLAKEHGTGPASRPRLTALHCGVLVLGAPLPP